ncbi:MAG: hypothetical protein R3F62_24785 [Planctomycetota bacterium]
MRLLLLLLVCVAAAFAADRAMLALEARGHVYWRRTKPDGSGATESALFSLRSFVEPSVRHVQEAQEGQAAEDEDPSEDDLPPGFTADERLIG